jgi:hypothetical protein
MRDYPITVLPARRHHSRKAAAVQAAWPRLSRRERRAAARWWWNRCRRQNDRWPLLWQQINANSGVI